MMYGYGVLNNHVPTLKATAMRGGSINPLNTNLYAVYKAESNANDSLATYNGTAQGGLTYSAGKSGNAFTFNGTNAYVQLPDNSLNFTGDFSVNFWMNLQGIGSDQQAPISNAQYNTLGTLSWGWYTHIGANTLSFGIQNGAGGLVSLSVNISSYYYTWTMFTIVRKASTGTKIYANGNLIASNSSTANPVYTTTHTPTLGCFKTNYVTPLEYFMKNGGKIDEVNIWNKELTSTEVTELYNTGTGKFYPY